jgi:hypothetical protein
MELNEIKWKLRNTNVALHYSRDPSKISRDRTCTVCHTTTKVLADLAGMAATAYSQPKFPR